MCVSGRDLGLYLGFVKRSICVFHKSRVFVERASQADDDDDGVVSSAGELW